MKFSMKRSAPMKRLASYLFLSVLAVLMLAFTGVTAQAAGPYNATSSTGSALSFVTSGKSGFGSELSLTGGPFVIVPAGAYESLGTSGTVQFWIKGSSGDAGKAIFGYDSSNNVIAADIFAPTTGAVRFYMQLNSSSYVIVNGTSTVCDGSYHHVVCMYGPGSASTVGAPTTSLYLMIDGVLQASSLNATGAYSAGGGAVNRNIGTSSGNTSNVWNGTIDDFALSNVMDYPTSGTYTVPSAPIANNHAGLIALYHFDGALTDSTTSPAMVLGTPTQTASGDGTATLDAGLPTGGSGSYTYAWHPRASDDDTSTTVAGTARTLVLTGLTNGVPQRYVCTVSDGTTTATSSQYVYAIAQKPLAVIFVGDSLTGGADGTPAPTEASSYLQALMPARKMVLTNYGFGGTRSDQWRTDSTTAYTQTTPGTYDTVSAGSASTLLNHALAGINAAVSTYGAANVVVHVCLGTNDPNTGDPTGNGNTTATNLTNILTALQATGAKVVLSDIPWRADYGNTYMAARTGHFDAIVAGLGGSAAGVYRGDTGAVVAFQAGHTEYFVGGTGPHDLQAYQVERAKLWATAIAKNVYSVGAAAPKLVPSRQPSRSR